MEYSHAFNESMDTYNQLKAIYEERIASDAYNAIISTMPFALLSVKQTYETLELFERLKTKPKITFHSVEEAEVLYENLKSISKNMDDLLDSAAYIEETNNVAKKINAFVSQTPYLNDTLMVEENTYLSDLAKDCIKYFQEEHAENGKKLLSFDFRYNFVESCLYSLDENDLQKLVSKRVLKAKDIDHISLKGNDKYMNNLKYLCFLTDHQHIIQKSITTKLKGVKFLNDDKTSRQDALRDLQLAFSNGEKISLKAEKYIYQPEIGAAEPAIKILWNDRCIGNISSSIAKDIDDRYINSDLDIQFKQVVGGGDLTYGCEVEVNILASELNTTIIVGQIQELEDKIVKAKANNEAEELIKKLEEKLIDLKKDLELADAPCMEESM